MVIFIHFLWSIKKFPQFSKVFNFKTFPLSYLCHLKAQKLSFMTGNFWTNFKSNSTAQSVIFKSFGHFFFFFVGSSMLIPTSKQLETTLKAIDRIRNSIKAKHQKHLNPKRNYFHQKLWCLSFITTNWGHLFKVTIQIFWHTSLAYFTIFLYAENEL